MAPALDFLWGVAISCYHQSNDFTHHDYQEQDKRNLFSYENPEPKETVKLCTMTYL